MNNLSLESNYQDSIKKFLLSAFDNSAYYITFDRTLKDPDLIEDTSIDKWVSVVFGKVAYGASTLQALYIVCCTRSDPEQYELVRVADFVRNLFIDNTMPDGVKRIPMYDFTNPSDEKPQIGFILPRDIQAGDTYDLTDQTKVKQLTIQLWYPTQDNL